MKRFIVCVSVLVNIVVLCMPFVLCTQEAQAYASPLIAIVIDDFGGNVRNGVEQMLSLPVPITCAVMPNVPYTKQDAEKAHARGMEVILHLPMEADRRLPLHWYGKSYIQNTHSPEQARAITEQCLSTVPHAVGINIHIGSGVCQKKSLMRAIMQVAKQNNCYFLDSFTSPETVCREVSREQGVPFAIRYAFLERTGKKSYDYAKQEMMRAFEYAKSCGAVVVIGHVGSEGGVSTYCAIRDCIRTIEAQGGRFVHLSRIVK